MNKFLALIAAIMLLAAWGNAPGPAPAPSPAPAPAPGPFGGGDGGVACHESMGMPTGQSCGRKTPRKYIIKR